MMSSDEREQKCEWWHAPVLVSGTGGSGTRGVVDVLSQQGIFVLGMDKKSCKPNHAFDTTCLSGCAPSNSLETFLAPNTTRGPQWRTLGQITHACDSKGIAQKALAGVPLAHRRKWGWGWKHPAMMYHLADLRIVFPCLHFVHTLRDPRDMSAVPHDHLANRANEWRRAAQALLGKATTKFDHRSAAIFLCKGDDICTRVVDALPSTVPSGGRGTTTSAFRKRLANEPALKRAAQCADLLLWSVVNPLLAGWARGPHGLRERGAYLPWRSEVQLAVGSHEASAGMEALQAGTLRLAAPTSLPVKAPDPVRRRRLDYGKWRALISPGAWEELDHCGNWQSAMQEFGYDVK
jgi:hypothetical protein